MSMQATQLARQIFVSTTLSIAADEYDFENLYHRGFPQDAKTAMVLEYCRKVRWELVDQGILSVGSIF